MVDLSVALMLFSTAAALVLPFTLGFNLGLVRCSAAEELEHVKQRDAAARLIGQMVRSDE